jgi:hypothetical protein
MLVTMSTHAHAIATVYVIVATVVANWLVVHRS